MNLRRKKGRGIRSHWKQQEPKTSGKIWKQDVQIKPQSKWPFKKWITINLKVIIWLPPTGQHASPFSFMPIVAIMMLKRRSSSVCWRKEKSFTTNTTHRPSLPAAVSCTQQNYYDEPSWRSELWTMISPLSCAIDQELWTRIRTFVLQGSTMISLLARSSWTFVLQCSMLNRDLFQRLRTFHVKKILAHNTSLPRWLLFVKGIHLYQTQVRHCQLFVKPKKDGVCILVGVVFDTIFFALIFDKVVSLDWLSALNV